MTGSQTWCFTRGCRSRRSPTTPRGRAAEQAPAHDLSVEEFLASPHVLVGTLPELVDKLERLRDELGFSSFTLSHGAMEDLAPLVYRLTGG